MARKRLNKRSEMQPHHAHTSTLEMDSITLDKLLPVINRFDMRCKVVLGESSIAAKMAVVPDVICIFEF